MYDFIENESPIVWGVKVSLVDRLLRVAGCVMMAAFPLSLMVEVKEGVPLLGQVMVWGMALLVTFGGFAFWVMGGGKIPSKHDIFG